MRCLLIATALVCLGGINAVPNCDPKQCQAPDCRCALTSPTIEGAPQLVMLTFDDAVTVANFPTYKDLTKKKQKNGCPVQATFFVSHEYSNYQLVHELHRRGHEIAVHSISHKSDTDFWKQADVPYWRSELQGMRELISKFAAIPISDINGVRLPFLQSSGNDTFEAMKLDNFLYDSSMPTLHGDPPLNPYTMDAGYQQECQIAPCPDGVFPGLWEVPLVAYTRVSTDKAGNRMEGRCSMVDACIPHPTTANDTFEYFKGNFERHYNSNRAPLPVFLHEAYLKDEARLDGYFQFVDYLLEKEDVFFVSVNEAINWIKNPQKAGDYVQNCVKNPVKTDCRSKPGYFGKSCPYENLEQFWGSSRYMTVCGNTCPPNYPWVGNNLGE